MRIRKRHVITLSWSIAGMSLAGAILLGIVFFFALGIASVVTMTVLF